MDFMRLLWTKGGDESAAPRSAHLREQDRHHGSRVADSGRVARSGHTGGGRADLLRQLSVILAQFAQLPEQVDQILTYDDVLAWFVSARPAGDVAHGGAVLRLSRGSRRNEIYQVFLDEHNEPLRTAAGQFLGRRLVVTALDEELADTFGDEDLIIVE